MKKLIVFIFSIFISWQGYAQSDEVNDWETYKVVEMDSVASLILWQNGRNFLQKHEDCTLVNQDSIKSVKATCGFWAYKSKLLKSIDGRIYFNLLVEVKENKYRYYINDFHFLPYTRNRYGRYEAQKGETKPLAGRDKSKKKAWKRYQQEAEEYSASLAGSLEAAMKKKPEKKAEKPSSAEW